MTNRLQKLERVRLPVNPVGFNQTIIINNPNININYLAQAKGPMSSKGLDSWHLNNNLKQFSETRQLGFFKGKHATARNNSNSPYIIHKVRTQDFKSINKVYGGTARDPFKDTIGSFRKNQTLQYIRLDEPKKQIAQQTLQKISKEDKINDRFYKSHARKMHRSELNRNIDTLPISLPANHANPQANSTLSFRRNRFAQIPQISSQNIEKKNQSLPTKQIQHKNKDKQSSDSEPEVELQQKKVTASKKISFSMRRHALSKTIQNINLGLLGQTQGYFDHIYSQAIPQAQIQLFIDSLNHPQQLNSRNLKLQNQPSQYIDYDFHFEEERKKRSITPKRKIPYQLDQ